MNRATATGQDVTKEFGISLSRLEDARDFLRTHFAPTPLVSAPYLSRLSGREVHLKLESTLPTGSFKPRGALFALRSRLQRQPTREVVTSSTGNHGAAVAYAARELGVSATVFLPTNPNPVKRAKITALGAKILEVGNDLAEAAAAASAYAIGHDAYFLDDAADLEVPVGAATIACEIFEQLPCVQKIYVPVGDTALIRGIAAVAKSRPTPPKIVGVQAERAPSYYDSWKSGEVRYSDLCDTIADGLATRRPLPNNVAAIRVLVDEMQLVTEQQMLEAIRCLWIDEHIESEPSGAAATAALLRAEKTETNEALVCIVSGRNITDEVREQAMSTGSNIRLRLWSRLILS
jgi:threonine dehydratase